jgi:signal transduction histidine kinase
LVSNALKHAFPAGRRGTVTIGFASRDGLFRLSVCDDGVGINAPGATKHGSLGLKVVDALVKQIGGTLSLGNDYGAQFVITFAVVGDGLAPEEAVVSASSRNGSSADQATIPPSSVERDAMAAVAEQSAG